MRTPITILLAALLAAPSAVATWSAKGTVEPDTLADVADGWMQTGPDATPTNGQGVGDQRPVYFNAFGAVYAGYAAGARTLANPNVAAAHTAHQPYPWTVYAILGVWKDCNGDGYVGIGEQGVWEYRAELLAAFAPGSSICTPSSAVPRYVGGPNHGQVVKNTPYPHNDGKWVREFIPIGWDEGAVSPVGTPGTVDYNPLNLNDSASRVWGDWGLPGDPPGGTCYVRPHPRGTFHSLGGLSDYADCFASGRIATTVGATPASGAWQDARPVGWGEEDDGSQAYVWDCGAPVGPNAKASTLDLQLHAPRATPGTGSGSLAGTANETGSGVTSGCTKHYSPDETNPGQQLASAPYATEDDVINTPQARNQPDHELVYSEGHRPADPIVAFRAVDPAMSGDPTMLGASTGDFDGVWSGTAVTAASRNPFVTRSDGDFEPQPVTYATFYAHVSPAAALAYHLTFPKGTSGTYGAEACPSIGPGQGTSAKSWKCDPADWWKDANGNNAKDKFENGYVSGAYEPEIGSTVGDPYEVRDVDCYDESASGARQAGVSYGLVTDTQCAFAEA